MNADESPCQNLDLRHHKRLLDPFAQLRCLSKSCSSHIIPIFSCKIHQPCIIIIICVILSSQIETQTSDYKLLFDFINLTQVHNFTVSAQDFFCLPSTFGIYRKIYWNFASSNADNETFCTVLLTSQVVIIQSLQPKGREFQST